MPPLPNVVESNSLDMLFRWVDHHIADVGLPILRQEVLLTRVKVDGSQCGGITAAAVKEVKRLSRSVEPQWVGVEHILHLHPHKGLPSASFRWLEELCPAICSHADCKTDIIVIVNNKAREA